MRKRSGSRNSSPQLLGPRSPLTILLIALLIGGAVYTIFHRTERTDPPRALSRAVEMLDFDPQAIQSLLDVANQEPMLQPWVALIRGRAEERRNNPAAALELYKSIPSTSPASLDAAVALIRLEDAGQRTTEQLSTEQLTNGQLTGQISELEQQLVRFRRPDLLGELGLLKASSIEEVTPEEALSVLLKLRLSSNDQDVIKRAIEHSQRLLDGHAKPAAERQEAASLRTALSSAVALDLVRALIRERDGINALSEVQTLTSRLPTQSATQSKEFFEARMLEEQVLRVLKRNEEADHLLSLLSADGPPGIADLALLKLAKNSWNSDDHDAALSFLASLRERFPTSNQNAEGSYVEARIYEETNQPADAKDTYEKLSTSTLDDELQIKSLHRIAWLYIRSQNYSSAAEFLRKIRVTAESAIKQSLANKDSRPLDFIFDEYLHGTYWEAICLSQLDEKERAAISSPPPNPDAQLMELTSKFPFTYYGILARRNLRFSDEKLPALDIPSTDGCIEALPPERLHLAELLQAGGLSSFAQHEVDWAFPVSKELNLKADLSRAAYYSQFATAKLAARTADAVLRNRNILTIEHDLDDELERCTLSTTGIAYLRPFADFFHEAAKKNEIKKELLYAIARTESFFDPNAVSRAGAIGLAQLLPSTAKYEGMKEGENLSDIRTNLSLAAKHLSRLLAQFAPVPEYAIAAYNAGAPAVNRWRTRYEDADVAQWVELIGYPETKDYVKKVVLAQAIYQELSRQAASAGS